MFHSIAVRTRTWHGSQPPSLPAAGSIADQSAGSAAAPPNTLLANRNVGCIAKLFRCPSPRALASTSSPDPTELFSCAYTWRCNPQKAISRRAAAPIPSNRRMASSMANQAPPLWKDIPFRILVTEARQRVLLPGGNCLIFALLFERRSRSRVTAGSCAKII
jgi:hypothetical protein